jgi:hypothetical protein
VVIGLDTFSTYFAAHRDEYVLIGGTAATIAMEEAGLSFRATKDLDIVLCVGVVSAAFHRKLWQFIAEGGYTAHASDDAQRPRLHRFSKPTVAGYPVILEFFSTHATPSPTQHSTTLTRVPFDGSITDLSAIALSDETFSFIRDGRRYTLAGVPYVGEDRLIPLKALAWADLRRRRAADPTSVDARDISKHRSDVFKLAQLLRRDQTVLLPDSLRGALLDLLGNAETDPTFDTTKLSGMRTSKSELLEILHAVFVD